MLVRSFAVSRYARLPDPAGLARAGQRVIVVPGADTVGVAITTTSGTTERLLAESHERAAANGSCGRRGWRGAPASPTRPGPSQP